MFNAARLPDIQNHWARPFIEALVQRGIIRGFDDGLFRPDQTMTRAEFAAILKAAFATAVGGKRPYSPFWDVPAGHWAAGSIRWAYEAKFLSGYPEGDFRMQDVIPRVQVLVALVSGLELAGSGSISLSEVFRDAAEIPDYAKRAIATATEAGVVVNYSDRQRLNPLRPATRGEVAAFIYQCLAYGGQVPAIASEWIVPGVRLVSVSHAREFRAAWVATVWNIDFPSGRSLTPEQQQAELVKILDRLQAMNFNAVIFQVRPEGDALYASALEPWSYWLSNTQGKAPDPAYDPLEFAIAQCRRRNLELHAWFNPYRARTSKQTVNVPPHIAATQPDVVYEWGTQLWMDPGSKVVQDRTFAAILDVVQRYDVDGIHLDDYFYPYPIAGQTFPDDKTYQAYRSGGGTLSLADWRRDNVNRLIQRITNGIRAAKPHVKFGISPFGIYRPGQPPEIKGLDAYDQLYADSLKWLKEGWVDYLSPQLYWRIDPPAQSYATLLNWWTDNNPKQRHIYPGNNLALLIEGSQDTSELDRQIALTRQRRSQCALGNIFYSMKSLAANRAGFSDRLKTETYRSPALPPSMYWLGSTPPTPPQGVRVRSNQLTWNPNPNVRAWTLYRQESNAWTLQKILPATTTALTVSPGTYALCASDRLANESQGVLAIVK